MEKIRNGFDDNGEATQEKKSGIALKNHFLISDYSPPIIL